MKAEKTSFKWRTINDQVETPTWFSDLTQDVYEHGESQEVIR